MDCHLLVGCSHHCFSKAEPKCVKTYCYQPLRDTLVVPLGALVGSHFLSVKVK